MLIDQIKEDWMIARKARESDKATLLSTLYSEALSVGKDDGNRLTSDVEVVARVKKFIKGVDENISILEKMIGEKTINELKLEKEWLSIYLPKQLSEEVLKSEIHSIMVDQDITDMKGMGLVMKTLKERFDGMYDGSLASKIVRETLA